MSSKKKLSTSGPRTTALYYVRQSYTRARVHFNFVRKGVRWGTREKRVARMREEEVRIRLLAKAEEVMSEMLVDKPATSEMGLADIERWVLRTGQEVQRRLLAELAQASEEAQSGEVGVCERSGKRMQRGGPCPARW